MKRFLAASAAVLALLLSPAVAALEAQTVVADFPFVADGWTEVAPAPLDEAWAAGGLGERGWGYSLAVARAEALCGARVGAYVVADFELGGEWALKNPRAMDVRLSALRVAELVAAEQSARLRLAGAAASSAEPMALVEPGSIEIEKLGRRWFRARFRMEPRSDIGSPSCAFCGRIEAEAIFNFDSDEDRLLVGYAVEGVLEAAVMLNALRFVDGPEDDEIPSSD